MDRAADMFPQSFVAAVGELENRGARRIIGRFDSGRPASSHEECWKELHGTDRAGSTPACEGDLALV